MATTTVEEFPRRAEAALHTAVGLGLLGFQHVQVQRQKLQRSLSGDGDGCTLLRRARQQVTDLRNPQSV